MLRKILDYQLSLTEKGKTLAPMRPLISAVDSFLFETPQNTTTRPHIRDAVDLKRWMFLVILALIPCILMAIWNSGLQSYVYSSNDYHLMDEYLSSLHSFKSYFAFAAKDSRYLSILWEGASLFLPVMIVSYTVGGLWEALFASVRGHEIAEGFLVTGMLYPLVLPPTLPLWMVAVGVSAGVILSKELFGGTGMNIMNPALACRAFVFFAYPGRMSGDVWVGSDPNVVRTSLLKMNKEAGKGAIDGYTQATSLAKFNVSPEIKRVHVDAIASNHLGSHVPTIETIKEQFNIWNVNGDAKLGELTSEQMQNFLSTPLAQGGLGLSPGAYQDACAFSDLSNGFGNLNSDWGFFFGNKLGCMGETSTLACLLGALVIIVTGIGSWRTMISMALGAFLTAFLFNLGSDFLSAEHGAWLPAQFSFPAYKHLLLGGMAFGLVFMATDPVSSPIHKTGQWIYGLLIGLVALTIRIINPAFPEGVMLAIILGNCFHPLIDYYCIKASRWSDLKRRKRRVI